jgi:hypothetical protein
MIVMPHWNAKAGEGGAQGVVTERIGIPMWHDDHCLLWLADRLFQRRGKPAGVDAIILRVGGAHGRSKA